MIDNKKEYILCSAIHNDDGKVHVHQPRNVTSGFVVCGRRHHNCFTTLALIGIKPNKDQVQGFLTSRDQFVTREEGSVIAKKSGHIQKTQLKHDELISEDLYLGREDYGK